MELHAQGRVAVPTTLPLDVERTKTVRPGPSGSAIHMERCVQGRVAVPPTLPLDVERTGCTPLHCHSTSSVPRRCAQARVAVPPTLPLDVERTGCTPSHCHSTSSARAARPHTATRRRAYQDGALRPEWQCQPHGTARSGPSGSAPHTATRRRAYGLHTLTLPLDVERTETVRPGPNGRATEAPVGGDCRPGGLPTTRVPRAQGVRREVREGPAPDRSHPGCGPGLPDGREDANTAQKSMSTLLKNKFHFLSSGHIV